MVAFDCGEREAFFDVWEELVPAEVRSSDVTARDLEFSLCVYFALYPMKCKVCRSGYHVDGNIARTKVWQFHRN